jgi:hypothetical protein
MSMAVLPQIETISNGWRIEVAVPHRAKKCARRTTERPESGRT